MATHRSPELTAAAPALDSPGHLGSKRRERPSRAEVPDTRSCWEKAIRLCSFFADMESLLREHYGEAVVVRDEWPRLKRDDFFHVDISTSGENAPPPMEIAREIYQLKKQSEFMPSYTSVGYMCVC